MTEADWRMDALADFFGATFVRIGEDGEPMNDTTRKELREDVADAFRAYASEMGGGEDWSQAYYDYADRTIALVTAARDAEIREAFATILEKDAKDTVWVNDHTTALDALDAAIGRAERGAEK